MDNEHLLTHDDRVRILHEVHNAAARRYILLPASAPTGDVSIDLDRVRDELPDAFHAINAIIEARRAVLNTVAPRE